MEWRRTANSIQKIKDYCEVIILKYEAKLQVRTVICYYSLWPVLPNHVVGQRIVSDINAICGC